MSFLRFPKTILVLSAVVLAAFVALAGREAVRRRQVRVLPSVPVNLAPDERRAFEEKVAASVKAIADDPQDFNAYVELALAKSALGERDGAAEVYRTMNQRFPGNFLSFSNLGQLYEEAGKVDLAAEQYLLAIGNAPRNPNLYRNIVNLYTYHWSARANDIPRILQKGLGVMPGSIDLMAMMAVYYRDFGQPEEAIRWYEQLLVFDQENTAALSELRVLKEQVKSKK